MSFSPVRCGSLEYLRSSLLSGVRHAFTTRYGGVSEGYLSSLNLGIHRGDVPEHVLENYRRLGDAVGFTPDDTVFAEHQIHSDIVRLVGRADRGSGLMRPGMEPCDGFVTNEPGTALCVFTADCNSVLLYDPIRHAVGAVHAGWRGTAAGIVRNAAELMRQSFGCDPHDLLAAIGPCISLCCFETDANVPEAMEAALGSAALPAIRSAGAKYHVDMKYINRVWLQQAGLTQEHIDICPACTACDPDRFWSHRRTHGLRGSLASVIVLT